MTKSCVHVLTLTDHEKEDEEVSMIASLCHPVRLINGQNSSNIIHISVRSMCLVFFQIPPIEYPFRGHYHHIFPGHNKSYRIRSLRPLSPRYRW